MTSPLPLVLASASPRRLDLLRSIGVEPVVRPADVDESVHDGELAYRYVERLAREKAAAIARPGEVVLGADTAVVLDNAILGKPADTDDARRMLTALSGKHHVVMTGVAVHRADLDRTESTVVQTTVGFASLTATDVDWYLATGESGDKAGAYGIQGAGGALVESISGSYSNVVGLPLAETVALVRRLAPDLRQATSWA